MPGTVRGLASLTLPAGAYSIVPAAWRRDLDKQVTNFAKGMGDSEEAIWQLHDVVRPDGETVFEVYEDRREMEGALSTDGRQFLVRSSDGEPLMAYEREGMRVGTPCTLVNLDTEEELATWGTSGVLGMTLQSKWALSAPDGTTAAHAKRGWSLGSLLHPDYTLSTADGTGIGTLATVQDGMFRSLDVELERSTVPTEILLVMAQGILRAFNQA
jgi:hypothetical protein